MASKVYDIITEKIIKALQEGVVPWRNPIISQQGYNYRHTNGASNRAYTGINPLLLDMACHENGWSSKVWLTHKQIEAKHGEILADQKQNHTPVIFWMFPKDDKEEVDNSVEVKVQKRRPPVLRYYRVWNLQQTTLYVPTANVPESTKNKAPNKLEMAEQIIAGYNNPPAIEFGSSRACYIPAKDTVKVPKMTQCTSPENFYATLFHELIHSTGHESRLKRHKADSGIHFGSEEYSREELVAEIGACFLCGMSNIQGVFDNNVAYIESWIKALQNDSKMVVVAAAQAQKAADYILGGNDES